MKFIYPVFLAVAFISSACGSPQPARSSLNDDTDLPSRVIGDVERYHPLAKFKPDDIAVIKLLEVDAGNCEDFCSNNEFRVTVGISKINLGAMDLVLTKFHVKNLDKLRRRSFLEDDTAQSVFKINVGSLNNKIAQMMKGLKSHDYEQLQLIVALEEVDPIYNDLNDSQTEALRLFRSSVEGPALYTPVLKNYVRNSEFEASAEVTLSFEKAEPNETKSHK